MVLREHEPKPELLEPSLPTPINRELKNGIPQVLHQLLLQPIVRKHPTGSPQHLSLLPPLLIQHHDLKESGREREQGIHEVDLNRQALAEPQQEEPPKTHQFREE